jgi:hypothetical protein
MTPQQKLCDVRVLTMWQKLSLLESAGDGGLSVSGDSGSLGVGERSLFVTNSSTGGPGGSAPLCCCACAGWGRVWGWGRPLAASGKGEACFITCCCWAVACGRPSTGIPFSDRNSSKSTYCKHNRRCAIMKKISLQCIAIFVTILSIRTI